MPTVDIKQKLLEESDPSSPAYNEDGVFYMNKHQFDWAVLNFYIILGSAPGVFTP